MTLVRAVKAACFWPQPAVGSTLVRLDRAGERVVGHVHDEVLVESDDLDRIRALMTESPSWAGGLPLNAAGFVCRRYRKD